jgi:hypothetical protein
MTDIVDSLRQSVRECRAVDRSSLLHAAADEIVRLREELDTAVRTLNACLGDYAKLRELSLINDKMVAYRLGVQHGSEGHAVQQ